MTRNEEITALVAEGFLPLVDIGRHFGITRERVRQIAARNGVRRDGVVCPARPRYVQQFDCPQCGQSVPVGQKRTHNRAMNHPYFEGSLLPSEIAELGRLYRLGLGYQALADIFDIVPTAAKAHVLRMKLPRHRTGERLPYSVIRAIKAGAIASRSVA